MTAAPRPWRSGFCSTYPHQEWQREACLNAGAGHARTPTKADPRDWVPCACACHRPAEEPPVTAETFDASKLDDPGPALPIALQLLDVATERLSEVAVGNIETLDWEQAVRHLAQLRAAVGSLQELDSLLVRRIYLAGPHGKDVAELDGIGRISIGRSQERKHWDERGVARAVIDRHMEDAENLGEAPDPWVVAEWLLEVYGINYCRVTPLRTLGLEPEAFCDVTPGKPTVSLPSRRR